MKNKKLHIFILFLLSGAIHSQTNSNPNIIKKDIKVNNAIDIIDSYNPNDIRFNRKLTPNIKIPVYYNKKFYASADILKKINPDSIATVEIINIPDSISKDFKRFIYVRKKNK